MFFAIELAPLGLQLFLDFQGSDFPGAGLSKAEKGVIIKALNGGRGDRQSLFGQWNGVQCCPCTASAKGGQSEHRRNGKTDHWPRRRYWLSDQAGPRCPVSDHEQYKEQLALKVETKDGKTKCIMTLIVNWPEYRRCSGPCGHSSHPPRDNPVTQSWN
jgi:hypothetical protein